MTFPNEAELLLEIKYNTCICMHTYVGMRTVWEFVNSQRLQYQNIECVYKSIPYRHTHMPIYKCMREYSMRPQICQYTHTNICKFHERQYSSLMSPCVCIHKLIHTYIHLYMYVCVLRTFFHLKRRYCCWNKRSNFVHARTYIHISMCWCSFFVFLFANWLQRKLHLIVYWFEKKFQNYFINDVWQLRTTAGEYFSVPGASCKPTPMYTPTSSIV